MRPWPLIALPVLLMLSNAVSAGASIIAWQDDFEDATLDPQWMIITNSQGATAGVNDFTAETGTYSMYLRSGYVVVVSEVIDLSGLTSAELSLWIQRGANNLGSNRPENGENLVLYYRTDAGTWSNMEVFTGGGTAGEIMPRNYFLPANALHANFQLRLIQVDGDNTPGDTDWWHIDNVTITDTSAQPPDLAGLCETFDSDLSQWTLAGSGTAQLTNATMQSAPTSLSLNGGPVSITSQALGLAGASATLSLWAQRGSNTFSDRPETGEDLVVSYLNNMGSWSTIWQLSGGGAAGQIYNLTYALPANALHSGFRLRIALLGGTDADLDFWHIDDVCFDIQRTTDHFAIVHDGSGINCQAEGVAIEAHDVTHFNVDDYTGTVSLSTSTGHGDWSLLGGGGVLSNSGNGIGSYSYAATDSGHVALGLRNSYAETINIHVDDGVDTEHADEDENLVYASAGFNLLINGIAQAMPAQIASKPSDAAPAVMLELQAIRSNDQTSACEAAFTGNIAVDIALSCETPDGCIGTPAVINGQNVASNNAGVPTAWTSVALDFGDAGDSTAPLVFRYDDAGRVQLHFQKPLSPSDEVMSGSSTEFTVRPFGFSVEVDEGAINTINPAAAGPGGSGFERAGEPFRATTSAVGWQSADDANADGIPDGHDDADPANNANLADNILLPNFAQESTPDTVTLDRTLVAPAGGSNPALTGTLVLGGFSNGSTSSNNLRWQEVGVIEISASLGDNDYLGAGAIHGRSGYVGRFVPHHFTTVVDDHGCSNAATFTWSKQPLRKLTITAFTADNSTAENFDYGSGGGFATDITLSDPSSPSPGSFNSIVSSATFVTGVAQLNDTVSFGFSAVETAPYSLAIRATDTDGSSSETFAEGQTEIRSGRLRLGFAAAPVMVDARSEIDTHRWTGAAWQLETDDSCTGLAIATSDFSYSDFQINLADGESAASNIGFYGGEGIVRFSNPGVGNDGSMRATLDVPEWLEFDWTGDSVPDDPFNTILFVPKHAREAGLIDLQEIVR